MTTSDSAPDVVAINAQMSRKIQSEPPQPLVEGGYALRVVHTTGRRSGARRSTPVGVVQRGGLLFLISPDLGRDWVRNLAADPACALDPGDTAYTAVAAPPDQATGAITAYLRAMRVPWALRAFPVGPDADPTEIAAHLDTIAVYRLDPPGAG